MLNYDAKHIALKLAAVSPVIPLWFDSLRKII
jgi:hypothetical protein